MAVLAVLLVTGLAAGAGSAASGTGAQPDSDLSKITVDTAPADSLQALVRGADAIVYGWFDSADRELPTGKAVSSGKLVNFVQTFHCEHYYKGESERLVRVLSTGIEPLPDAMDPLNRTYPGPMIEGAYVSFLKRVPGSDDVYTIEGGWQGVYPVHDGRIIALEGAGFKELEGLTLGEFAGKLQGR